jgi:hypothetical protein
MPVLRYDGSAPYEQTNWERLDSDKTRSKAGFTGAGLEATNSRRTGYGLRGVPLTSIGTTPQAGSSCMEAQNGVKRARVSSGMTDSGKLPDDAKKPRIV